MKAEAHLALTNFAIIAVTVCLPSIVMTSCHYLVSVVETVIHKPGDERGLPNCTNTATDAIRNNPGILKIIVYTLYKSQCCVTDWGKSDSVTTHSAFIAH